MSPKYSLGARAQAITVLALVATVGALIGILGDRLVAQHTAEGWPAAGPPPFRGGTSGGPRGADIRYGERLARMLDLTSEQRAAIDTILAEEQLRLRELTRQYQPQFRAIADQTRTRVDGVLTDAQRERLRTLRDERFRRVGEDRPGMRDALWPGVRNERPRGQRRPQDTLPSAR